MERGRKGGERGTAGNTNFFFPVPCFMNKNKND